MREHDDIRAQAEQALGQPVSSFSTDSVIEAKLALADRTVSLTAPAGTPADELVRSLIAIVKSGAE